MTNDQIIELKCLKHVKIYKLKQGGLSNKDIATILSTNTGHVYNVLKKYDSNSDLRQLSDSIIN